MGIFDDEMNGEALRRTHEAERKTEAEAAVEREIQEAYGRDAEVLSEFVQTMRRRRIGPQSSTWPTVRMGHTSRGVVGSIFRKQEVLGKGVVLDGWLINRPAAPKSDYVTQPAVLGLLVTEEGSALVGLAKTLGIYTSQGFPQCYRWDPLSIDHYRGFGGLQRIYSEGWLGTARGTPLANLDSDWIKSSLLGYVRGLH